MLKTALMLTPIFAIVALAFWLILPSKPQPLIISGQQQIQNDSQDLTGLSDKLNSLEHKVNSLESSNSALISKINNLQSVGKTTSQPAAKKSPVLIPINAGGNINSTEWTNLTSGSITINPADYPGYKNA